MTESIRIAKITVDVIHVRGAGRSGRIKVETESGQIYYLPDNPGIDPDKAKNRLYEAAAELARDAWSLV